MRGRHEIAFSLFKSKRVNSKRYDVTDSERQSLGGKGLGATEREDSSSLHSLDWGRLNDEGWARARTAVAKLRDNGFFCIGGPFGFEDPELLWVILTYAYGNGQFGSQALEEWIEIEPVLSRELAGRRVSSSDIRLFRRNNRKAITLSLEGFFKQEATMAVQGLRRIYGFSECELAEQRLLEAIRSDVGEVDY